MLTLLMFNGCWATYSRINDGGCVGTLSYFHLLLNGEVRVFLLSIVYCTTLDGVVHVGILSFWDEPRLYRYWENCKLPAQLYQLTGYGDRFQQSQYIASYKPSSSTDECLSFGLAQLGKPLAVDIDATSHGDWR